MGVVGVESLWCIEMICFFWKCEVVEGGGCGEGE